MYVLDSRYISIYMTCIQFMFMLLYLFAVVIKEIIEIEDCSIVKL